METIELLVNSVSIKVDPDLNVPAANCSEKKPEALCDNAPDFSVRVDNDSEKQPDIFKSNAPDLSFSAANDHEKKPEVSCDNAPDLSFPAANDTEKKPEVSCDNAPDLSFPAANDTEKKPEVSCDNAPDFSVRVDNDSEKQSNIFTGNARAANDSDSIQVTINHLKGKKLGEKLEGVCGNYRIMPTLFDSVDVESDCTILSTNNIPWTSRYLNLLLDSFNENYGGPRKDLEAKIKTILQSPHPKGASYLPPTKIYRRLWHHRYYEKTPPTGACGYFMCDQALSRSWRRRNLSFDETNLQHYPSLIDHSAKIISLRLPVDKKYFVEYFNQAVEIVDKCLKTATAEEAFSNPLLAMLRSFRQKELAGVKDWLNLKSVGGSEFDGREPRLPKEYWFDGRVLPFIFNQPDVVNLTVFRLSSNIDKQEWGGAEQSSHSLFLKHKESADFETYRDIIIPNMNYFAYDGSHFWLIPTCKESDELLNLDRAYTVLAAKVVKELEDIHHKLNMNLQHSQISDIKSDCETISETKDSNDSSTTTDANNLADIDADDLAITVFPSSIRVRIGLDEKQDKFFKRDYTNVDSSICFYGRFTFGLSGSKSSMVDFYPAYATCVGKCITVGDVIRIDDRDCTLLFISSQSIWPCVYLIETAILGSKFVDDPEEALSRMVSDITGRLTNGFESVTVWSQTGLEDSDKCISADDWLLNKASFGALEMNRNKFKAFVLMVSATFASYLSKNRLVSRYI